MKKISILTILKRIVSVILGSVSAIFLFLPSSDLITGADRNLHTILFAAMFFALLLFFILWNISKSKYVYLLLLALILAIPATSSYGEYEIRVSRENWAAMLAEMDAEREAQREQAAAEQEAQRIRAEAERQVLRDAMDTVMYVDVWGGLGVWSEPMPRVERTIGRLPYRSEVRLSRNHEHMVRNWRVGDWMVFVAQGDVEGWVPYSRLVETIEFESILGHWRQEGDWFILWSFSADGSFSTGDETGGRWGTFELEDDNQMMLTFDYHPLVNFNDIPDPENFVLQRFFYTQEAEIIFVNTDRRILQFDGYQIALFR